jgi:hypothetical protein
VRSTTKQSRISFPILFISLSLKGLATIFLDQARKRQRTCHAVVSSLRDALVFLILLGRCGTQLLQSNNFKQVLTLYPHKIKNTSATQMRGFKD